MIRKNEKFTQESPASEWRIKLPTNYVEGSAVVEVVRDTLGQSVKPEYDKVVSDELVINFGLNSRAGSAWYSWLEPDNQSVVSDEAGNTVNITITQNGGNIPSGATF